MENIHVYNTDESEVTYFKRRMQSDAGVAGICQWHVIGNDSENMSFQKVTTVLDGQAGYQKLSPKGTKESGCIRHGAGETGHLLEHLLDVMQDLRCARGWGS